MSQSLSPELEELVSLYAKVKRLVLEAEQFDSEQQSNIAIIKEQSYALDHLMRYLGDIFNPASPREQYRSGNLRAVRAHLCRVGFDALDDLGISLKLRIHRAVMSHSNEAIVTAIPHYFTKSVAQVAELDRRIEESRANKDVGSFEPKDLDAYAEFVMGLKSITIEIDNAVPAMVAFDMNQRRWRLLWRGALWFVVGVVVAKVIDLLGNKWFGSP
jgi:hypothetical protein